MARTFAETATEADLLKVFTDLEDKAGLAFVFHVRDARGQRLAGLPDLIVVAGDTLGAFETKTQRDEVTERQSDVIRALSAITRVEAAIVRPVPRPGEIDVAEALRRLGLAAG